MAFIESGPLLARMMLPVQLPVSLPASLSCCVQSELICLLMCRRCLRDSRRRAVHHLSSLLPPSWSLMLSPCLHLHIGRRTKGGDKLHLREATEGKPSPLP